MAAHKPQAREPLIFQAEIIMVQQEVQNFEDLPFTKETVVSAPQGIFPAV